MYLPPNHVITSRPIERVALIGAPGSGKTTSALTFPNTVWLDFDHKLPIGLHSYPFWDAGFCDKLASRTFNSTPNARDAFMKFMRDHYTKFEPEQTLVIDSASKLLNALDRQCWLERDAQGGTKDSVFQFWGHKLKFWQELMTMLKSLHCKSIVIFHETQDREENGELNGKLKPILDGSYKDQILGDFTDVWRCIARPPLMRGNMRKRDADNRVMLDDNFYWQLVGDDKIDTNTNPVLGAAVARAGIRRVKADYGEITKLYDSVDNHLSNINKQIHKHK